MGSILAGLRRFVGIEGVAQAAHGRQVVVGEQLAHEADFFDADAVLAGHAAAAGDALVENFAAGREHALRPASASRSSNSRIGWMLPSPA